MMLGKTQQLPISSSPQLTQRTAQLPSLFQVRVRAGLLPKSILPLFINLIVGESPNFFCLACTKSRAAFHEELQNRKFAKTPFKFGHNNELVG